jgi:benzoyl-CoA reductase/2-hydroxyglutaryl-CoA dehydratase subunit BcrC/BadD/HgdB
MAHINAHDILEKVGVNLELHDRLMAYNNDLHERTFSSFRNRPAAMAFFDQGFHASHAGRVAEIFDYRQKGGKSIGTFCIYVPDEIALAANVLPIPLCGGSHWPVDYADKMFPREICPLVRSTFGMAFSNTCPYKKLKDGAVGETTCDAKKKAWDLLGFEVMEVPQKKTEMDRALWISEVKRFRGYVEKLSGVTVTASRLKETIALVNERRRMLQAINAFRALPDPPISGLDALLVSQVALNQDIHAFIDCCKVLIDELEHRVRTGISAYGGRGPRILLAGTPSPLGNAKVHYALESSGLQVVADESCTGIRYYRDLVDESPSDLDGMIEAVADRYFSIDCSCFSPNTERVENIQKMIKDFRVDGVVHNILSFCHTYNVEAKVIDKALASVATPSLKIVTDYSFEDLEQLKVRIESFSELLQSKVEQPG